ncbi:flavocytochrome c, partial [Ostertagia ostertagi]
LETADLNETSLQAPSADEPIIIVGGGLAGLSAALEALSRDAKVIIIDSEKNLGGNSAKASSGVSAAETSTQKQMGINDSRASFYKDTMSAGDRENDEGLVDLLVEQSADAIEFLKELGVNLNDINLCGGHSTPRTHWIPSPKEGRATPVGLGIINAAKQRVADIAKDRPDDVTILTNTRVVGLTSWNAYVNGVNVVQDGKRKEINGKAVILTTGGYSADRNEDASLLHEFASDKLRFPTTNGAFARGDGVKMARAMGAQINSEGVRFANELGRRDYLTERIQKECKPIEKFQGGSAGLSAAIMLMNDDAADSFGRPAFNFYAVVKKFFMKYDSAKELAAAMDISPNVLEKTLMDYNKYAKSSSSDTKEKDSFGKTVFPVAIEPDQPIYAAIITPAIHYTMGGLKIDKQARVYNEFMNQPFKGLLAAGEVTDLVIADRIRGPSCVSMARPEVSTSASEAESNSTVPRAVERDPRAPKQEWRKAKVAEFSMMRSRMESAPRKAALRIKWPNSASEEQWEELLLRRCHPNCVHFSTAFPHHQGTPPAVPVVLSISSSTVNAILPYAVEWAECGEFTRALREWIFALLLIVQKPLMPDVCAAIRGLANLCRSLRNSVDIERKDEIRELSWFITIVSEYFGQTDLADL